MYLHCVLIEHFRDLKIQELSTVSYLVLTLSIKCSCEKSDALWNDLKMLLPSDTGALVMAVATESPFIMSRKKSAGLLWGSQR